MDQFKSYSSTGVEPHPAVRPVRYAMSQRVFYPALSDGLRAEVCEGEVCWIERGTVGADPDHVRYTARFSGGFSVHSLDDETRFYVDRDGAARELSRIMRRRAIELEAKAARLRRESGPYTDEELATEDAS